MGEVTEKLLTKIRLYVLELFVRRDYPALAYHNLRHTETVVERCHEIANHFVLSDEELFCLIAAAWFHDTGHLFNELRDHEQAGADLMAALLKAFSVDEGLIRMIADCILGTKMPSNPETTIEKIICDADTYHFGTKEFFTTDPKTYAEMEYRLGMEIDDKICRSIKLLESHRFFTSYCQDLLNGGKQSNINFLKNSLS
jgi:predicted metal-dependent HD superfamily phosphohydrolase